MAEAAMNDFMILLSDLAAAVGVSAQALHKYVKTNGFETLVAGHRAYLTPEAARALLMSRNFQYKRQVVSLQMLKGGVAKTTTAMNIGIRANMYGARVLLVDLDQQANLSFAFGIEDPDAPVWVDVIEGKTPVDQSVRRISPTLHVIPSNLNNSMLDRVLLTGKRNVGSGVSQYLAPIRDQYDLVILDTAPNLSAINTAASCASDLVLLPVNPDKFSFVGLTKTRDDLQKIKQEFSAHFESRVLFTKFDGRETASHELLKLCLANYGSEMMKAFVRTSTEVKNTIRTNRSIFEQRSNAKDDYDLVTRELMGMTS